MRSEPLEALHALQTSIYRDFIFDADPTNTGTSAIEAFGLKRGAMTFMYGRKHMSYDEFYCRDLHRRISNAKKENGK